MDKILKYTFHKRHRNSKKAYENVFYIINIYNKLELKKTIYTLKWKC